MQTCAFCSGATIFPTGWVLGRLVLELLSADFEMGLAGICFLMKSFPNI